MTDDKNLHTLVAYCDAMIDAAQSLKHEIMQMNPTRELLCGLWMQKKGRVSFRIWRENDRYRVEERFANDVNGRMKIYTNDLMEDKSGNLYIDTIDRAIGYDRKKDRLLVETLGAFDRQK